MIGSIHEFTFDRDHDSPSEEEIEILRVLQQIGYYEDTYGDQISDETLIREHEELVLFGGGNHLVMRDGLGSVVCVANYHSTYGSNPDNGTVHRIVVNNGNREVGYGRLMMAALEAKARTEAKTGLVLDANPNVVDFYKSLGYYATRDPKKLPEYVQVPMRKDLDSGDNPTA